jgi:crossover junction endodeoxyribonuclease RuvC
MFIGIDPGANGCIVAITADGSVRHRFNLKDKTPHDIGEFFNDLGAEDITEAVIEKVSSSPQQGVVSAFSFGKSYGLLIGMLASYRIPYREETPQKWQKYMGCMSKGDKNVTKAAAQRLWPSDKFTHANADATLIAEYCRMTAK